MNDKITARLDHLQLFSEAPERLAAFHREAMGTSAERIEGGQWLCEGPERRLLIARGKSKSLGFAAYRLHAPAMLAVVRERLLRHGVELLPSPTPLFAEAVSFLDPDGNRFVLGVPDAGRAVPAAGGLPARLQHVVVATRDVARMARFYSEVVGFTVSDTVMDGDQATACFIRTDNEHHSFAVFRAPEQRLDHHCYEAGDWALIRDWADHFAAKGIKIAWGPGRHGPGNNLFIMVHDPDGNWLEISAELETVADDRPAGVWPHEQSTLNKWGQAFLRS